jgi:hypothetical protein
MLRDEGIDLLVDLIIGLPGDTPDDVARGVDFLLEHGLADHAQVFVLSLLPGTAMRATAHADGVEFDPAPPYRVRSTPTFSQDALRASLFAAEDKLGRRLDELPRPHLVGEPRDPLDVIVVNLDDAPSLGRAGLPGAQHCALWLKARDLFARRELALRALDARLAVDPYAVLDVVLCSEQPFPLDLLDLLRARLDRATPSYASRALALRGEDMQRRIAVVLPVGRRVAPDWVQAVCEHVPVYREQSAREALARAPELGDAEPGARILDAHVAPDLWRSLVEQADPSAVSFAQREHEQAWVTSVLGDRDAS